MRDYVQVYLDGIFIGKIDRRINGENTIKFNSTKSEQETLSLILIVENMGRINFGEEIIHNYKGIIGDINMNDKLVENWQTYKITLDSLKNLKNLEVSLESSATGNNRNNHQAKDVIMSSPILFKGKFTLNNLGDTYLDFTLWGKGAVWINGNNIGRYWFIGPQQTLYVPVELLKAGENEIIVFEMLRKANELNAIDNAILDYLPLP